MTATRQKQLGAFYTPPLMAEQLVAWAVRDRTDHVLDPSFGGLVFLDAASQRLEVLGAAPNAIDHQLHGVDVDAEAFVAARASGRDASRWLHRDFFYVRPGEDLDRAQAVVGNPPYVRYQSFTESRQRALDIAAGHGVPLTRMTSSWAPFVIHAADFVSQDGRLAQVLPAELMHAQYAAEVLSFMTRCFARVVVAVFDERVFPGAQEEVVLLMADVKGGGPAPGVELVQARSMADLDLDAGPRALLHGTSDHKLLAGLLPTAALEVYERTAAAGETTRLGALGSVDIGAVTGANDFFVLSAARAAAFPRALMRPAVSKAAHVPGACFTEADLLDLDRQGSPSRMFVAGADDPHVAHDAVQAHLAAGEDLGVHERYKCRIRTPWWAVPERQARVPQLLLTYMAAEMPRLVANEAGVASTNTVHGVHLLNGTNPRAMAASFYNSLTLLAAELVGRSYGGGVLKLEPTEAEGLIVPTPRAEWARLLPTVDAAVRGRRYDDLVSEVDRVVLIEGLGMSDRDVAALRAGHTLLRERRRSRGAAR